MRRALSLIIASIVLTMLTGCMHQFSIEEVNKAILSDFLRKPENLQYFGSVEEAVTHNTLEGSGIRTVDESTKVFNHYDLAVFFFRSSIDNKDTICVTKHYTSDGQGTLYSVPVNATNIIWESWKTAVITNKCDEIGEIKLCITLLNMSQVFAVDSTKNFIWGISQSEEIKKLKIEGQPVAEVIEVEMDGETGYFWYFDDLKIDKPLAFKDFGKHTEGELTISMD